jgi:hypothetical protein
MVWGAYRTAVVIASNRLVLRRAEEADAERAWMWRDQEATRRYFHESRIGSARPASRLVAGAIRAVGRRCSLPTRASVHRRGASGPRNGEATLSIYLDPTVTAWDWERRCFGTREWLSRHHPEIAALRLIDRAITPRNAHSRGGFDQRKSLDLRGPP